MLVNGNSAAGVNMNKDTYTISCTITEANKQNFTVLIESGLKNPSSGPYSYSQFNIEFETSDGWSIDQVLTSETWIDVPCGNDC